MKNKFIVWTALAAFSWLGVDAQSDDSGVLKRLERGMKAYEQERYAAAYQDFAAVQGRRAELNDVNREMLDYYHCLTSFELGKGDAIDRVESFRRNYPQSIFATSLDWIYANVKFDQKDYQKALELFRNIEPNVNKLTIDEQQEFHFKKGYSLINLDGLVDADFRSGKISDAANMLEAQGDFQAILSTSRFYPSAQYYLAYIEYFKGDLDRAQSRFESLIGNSAYGNIVPFYLLQIKFLKGEYQTVIADGVKLRAIANKKWKTEIAHILAESYFNTGNYHSALTEIVNYKSEGGMMTSTEVYMKGYCHFVCSEYSDAEKELRKIANIANEMGQNAAFLLGRTYLKLGNKNKALMAFSLATAANYDKEIKEEAMFNRAKLQCDLVGNSFNRAIGSLKQFIELYPNSKHIGEARELLLSAYFNSRDYQAALDAIQYIKNPDNNEKSALQKIAYFRALEHYENGDYQSALKTLNTSLEYRYNAKYTALGKFWKAETLVKLGKQSDAATLYKEYIALASKSEPEFAYAYYGLGYCRFNQQKWDDAQIDFEKLTTLNTSSVLKADAYNRLGDIEFARRSYWKAIEQYNKVTPFGGAAANYSAYRRAIMYGLVDRPQKKENELKNIISKGNSEYVDDAIYQLGALYVKQEQFAKGADQFKLLVEKYPNSPYIVQALSDLGLVYQNMGNDNEALKYYKMVTQRFPTSTQARDALLGIRNIYVDRNDIDSYVDFAAQSGIEVKVSISEKDSLSYTAAEKSYLSGNMEKAVEHLQKYVDNYPQGGFLSSARYFLADAHLRLNNQQAAIDEYERLYQMPINEFTERALQQAGDLNMKAEKWQQALVAYERLFNMSTNAKTVDNALEQALKCVSKIADNQRTIELTDKALASGFASKDTRQRAEFLKARALDELGNVDEALVYYKKVAENLKRRDGAESKFRIIRILYNKDLLKEAEAEVFDFSDKGSPYQYWTAKAFLILGDIYVKQGDLFQAKATLQSIVDGYLDKNDGVVDEARKKIEELN